MTNFDRFSIGVVAAAVGLYAVALALSPNVVATPLNTGGHACIENSAGVVGGVAAGAAGGAAVPAADSCAASAPVADMAGIPMALPGPVPVVAPAPVAAPIPAGAPVPLGAPVPVGAPVPAAAPVPVAAPVPAGAPILDMAGGFSGKGDPNRPPAPGAPVSGQPIPPGPGA
jgi:hypothetical protein